MTHFLVVFVALATFNDGGQFNPPDTAGADVYTTFDFQGGLVSRRGSGTALIINGDFEMNSATGCEFNLSNDGFNATVSNATAFGLSEEIDVMLDPNGCNFGLPPQSGLTKLGIAAQGVGEPSDAFSLDLSQVFPQGECLVLRFYAQAVVDSFSPDISPVRIGLSNDPEDFGDHVFTGTPASDAWTFFDQLVCAPNDAFYVTVDLEVAGDSWNHVDNFSLLPRVIFVDGFESGDTSAWTFPFP